MVEFSSNSSYSASSRHLIRPTPRSSSILPILPNISSTGSVTSTYCSSYRAQRSSLGSHSSSRSPSISSTQNKVSPTVNKISSNTSNIKSREKTSPKKTNSSLIENKQSKDMSYCKVAHPISKSSSPTKTSREIVDSQEFPTITKSAPCRSIRDSDRTSHSSSIQESSLYNTDSFSSSSSNYASSSSNLYNGRQSYNSYKPASLYESSSRNKINHAEIEKIANKYRRSVSIDSLGSNRDTSYRPEPKSSSPKGSGLVGLKNLGNTCFMNSIIQCLSHSYLVREYFLSKGYKNDLSTSSKMQGRLAEEFANLLGDLWSGKYDTVSPNKFKSAVAKSAPRFVGYSQQDSQEFLRFFLEGLHEDLNKGRKGKRRIEEPPKGLSDDELADLRWKDYIAYDNSSIVNYFVGMLKSTLTCSVCDHKSVTFDPFWDLSLPLPRSRSSVPNLQSCFSEFTQEEILDGDEKPTCESCKKRQKCTKQFSIQRFPPMLVLHLKRFSEVRYRTKLSTKVDFPIENLDLSKVSSNPNTSTPMYDLLGVSNHSGNTFSGHYIAYCKSNSRWHRFSDSSVSGLSRSDIVSSEAYVLFYERKR